MCSSFLQAVMAIFNKENGEIFLHKQKMFAGQAFKDEIHNDKHDRYQRYYCLVLTLYFLSFPRFFSFLVCACFCCVASTAISQGIQNTSLLKTAHQLSLPLVLWRPQSDPFPVSNVKKSMRGGFSRGGGRGDRGRGRFPGRGGRGRGGYEEETPQSVSGTSPDDL